MIEIIGGMAAAILALIAVVVFQRKSLTVKEAENELLQIGLERAEHTLNRIDEIKRKVDEARSEAYQEKIIIQEQIESGDRSFLDNDHV